MEYTLIRSKRRTISIMVGEDGQLVARAPIRCPRDEIDQFILSKSSWIEKQRKRMAEIKDLATPISKDDVKDLTEKARIKIAEKAEHYAKLMGVTYKSLTIRSQRTRWGSCSSKGNLNFNCLLMMCPPACLDYVVIHELAHLIHMNHSPEFWDEVSVHMPDYRLHRAWLKKYGPALLVSLPIQTQAKGKSL